MRRHPPRSAGAYALLLAASVAVLSAGFTPGLAAAAGAPAPTPSTTGGAGASQGAGGADTSIGPATPGVVGCTLPTNLDEVTGMVVTDKGIAVIEGHNDNPSNVRISFVDAASCKATVTNYTGPDPLDPQDLAIGSDGAFWVADTGDTQDGDPSRERIAVEKAPAAGGKATIYRFQYPGGASLDAQAMLLDKGDVPIILAHDAGGKTGIYKPATPLQADITENLPQMTKLGEFTPAKTNTANPKGPVGQQLVTGAAKAPDGKHVVIRTMSDAYEFEVGADGDIAKAITTGKPAVTPLPNEPQGEAIAYSSDGGSFLTFSVMPDGADKPPTLLTYKRYIPPPPAPEAPSEPEAPAQEQGFLQKLSFSEMTRIVAAVGVVGLVLAIAGIIGIRRARRRRREEEYDDYDDYDDDPRPRRGRGRGRDDGYSGLREPAYSGGYDDQGGYGDPGYGGNSYGAGGFGANGYGAGGYADAGYGGQQYAEPTTQYGGQAQQQYPDYGAQPQPQQYPDYGAQPQQYPDYGAQPQQYPPDYGAQGQYGGYGYEDDFDPLQDPRRR